MAHATQAQSLRGVGPGIGIALGIAGVVTGVLYAIGKRGEAPVPTDGGLTGEMLFIIGALIFIGSKTFSKFFEGKAYGKATGTAIGWLAVAAVIWWFIWGGGTRNVAEQIGVAGAVDSFRGEAHRKPAAELNLRGQWVSVARKIPGCWEWSITGPARERGGKLRYMDGTEMPMGVKQYHNWKGLEAVWGHGKLYLWVTPRSCADQS